MFLKNMKRRNPELANKNRKLPKRCTKYGDGSFTVSMFLTVKLLAIWSVIVTLDLATGFRLEYMYPCWLMIQSVIDAYKYQGVGFTVFFISMVVTSDILVYMFLPTTAMFFLASLYVWIQLMMHSGVERGICVQTVLIWMVFLYLEATMRLRDKLDSSSSSYFSWDICRPFAAHCVGYPLVTFSFSVKSFIGFKYRKHKQLQIAGENRLFRDLINEALPEENRRPLPEVAQPLDKGILAGKSTSDSNGFTAVDPVPVSSPTPGSSSNGHLPGSSRDHTSHSESRGSNNNNNQKRKPNRFWPSDILVSFTKVSDPDQVSSSSSSSASSSVADSDIREPVEVFARTKKQQQQNLNLEIDNCDRESVESEKAYTRNGGKSGNNRSTSPSIAKLAVANSSSQNTYEKESVSGNPGGSAAGVGRKQQKGSTPGLDLSPKQDDLYYSRLEGDMKRLRSDLQSSRQFEQDLRSQLATLQSTEKSSRLELVKLQQENESLQQRLNKVVAARQQEKQAAAVTEKLLAEEKKARLLADTQLAQEKKQRKAIEDAVPECSAMCKNQRKETEAELRQLRRDLANKEEKMRNQGEEIHIMKQRKESSKDADMLSSALTSLQDKNAHLENSLGQETKLKLDLFSALGEAKRQLEISQNVIQQRDKDIVDLKAKINRLADVMTLVPSGNAANQSAISAFVADALKQGGSNSSPSNNSNNNGNGHRGMSPSDNHLGYN